MNHSTHVFTDLRELDRYGCSIDQIKRDVANSAYPPEQLAVDIMSHAQHELSVDHVVQASQMINRVKYILSEYCNADSVICKTFSSRNT